MSVYTGNPSFGRWVSVTLPDDASTPKDVASVNIPFSAILDKLAWVEYGNSVIFANMPTTAGFPGAKIYVDLLGWYSWAVASPYPAPFNVPDGWFIVGITAPGGGVWMWEHMAEHAANKLPLIGPGPGDPSIYPTTTSVGRINKAVIDHGYHSHLINTVFNTTASTNLNTPQLLFFEDVGTLQSDDIVDSQMYVTGNIVWDGIAVYSGSFTISTDFSEDGGFTWTTASSATYYLPVVPPPVISCVVQTSFARKVGAPGAFQIRIRGNVERPAAHETLNLAIHSWLVTVTRP